MSLPTILDVDLQEKVAELLLQVRHVVARDRVGDFVGFFDRVGGDAVEGLLDVPWAAIVRITKLGHDGEQALDRMGGFGRHGPSFDLESVVSLPTILDVDLFRPALPSNHPQETGHIGGAGTEQVPGGRSHPIVAPGMACWRLLGKRPCSARHCAAQYAAGSRFDVDFSQDRGKSKTIVLHGSMVLLKTPARKSGFSAALRAG